MTRDEIIKNTMALKKKTPIEKRLHLCESCSKDYPECDATFDGIKFGSGVGNDNVIGCTAYVNRWKAQEPRVPVDALALLKEQEPVKPIPHLDGGFTRYEPIEHLDSGLTKYAPITFFYECGVCGAGLMFNWVACPECGKAVKWNA